WGIEHAGRVEADMKKVKARKDAIVASSREGVESWLRGTPGCTVIHEHARFEGPRTLRAGEQLLEAPLIFINAGGRASAPPIPGLSAAPFLNNSSMMDVDFLPGHLVILGGSYIACEFAQMYRRFGSEVTVVERGPRLLPREDPDISEAVHEIFESE